MQIGGHGDPVKLATAIRAGLGEGKTPLTAPAASASPPAIDLDTAQLDQIIGVKGQATGGVYQLGVPRRDPVIESGMQLPAKEVTLFLGNTAAGIEPLRLPTTHVEGATWRVENVAIPTIGRWQMRVEILINDFEKIAIEDQIDLSR